MFESVKALIVVFVVCVGAFVFARIAFGEFVSVKIMDRWRNVFLLSTVAAFLIPNFWVFCWSSATPSPPWPQARGCETGDLPASSVRGSACWLCSTGFAGIRVF
ncbi:MAG: hypothetical protein R3C42_06340 [Parvularculaceae bacterium]